MRTLTSLATLAVALTTSAIAVRPAEACGGYGGVDFMAAPQVLRLSSHFTDGGQRTFAMVAPDDGPKGARFEQLAPHSYDGTAIASAPTRDIPLAMTLVGSAGTRKVSSAKSVLVARSFISHGQTMSALEVSAGKGEFQIAVVGGRFRKLAWNELTNSEATSTAEVAWLKQRGVDVSGTVYKQALANQVVAFSTYDTTASRFVTTMRWDDVSVTTANGMPLGILVADGISFVVLDDHGITTTQRLW